MWMKMNENSKNNKHNFGTSTRYSRIHILTEAPRNVMKTKARLYHKNSIPQCEDVVVYSSTLTVIGKDKPDNTETCRIKDHAVSSPP
jgi:hypothetical protein